MKSTTLILIIAVGLISCSDFYYTRFLFNISILDLNNQPIKKELLYVISCNLVGWAENNITDSSKIYEQFDREYYKPEDFFGKGAELGIHVFIGDTVIIDTLISFDKIPFKVLPYDNYEYQDTMYVY